MTTFMVYQCTYIGGKTYSMCFEGSQKSQRGLLLFSRVQTVIIPMFLQMKMYVIFDAKTKKERKEIHWLDIITTYITTQYLSHEYVYKNYKNQ